MTRKMYNEYFEHATSLLQRLVATPSISREEREAADTMQKAIEEVGFDCHRCGNNVWAVASAYDDDMPTLLLNAHIDTVKPVDSWTRNPFSPTIENGRLYGLGANDCGGGLVSLFEAFRILSPRRRKYNLIYLASAEEEVSGKNGFEMVLPLLPPIHTAIVGEPTGMMPATAEKGLMVLDITSRGKSGHAARGGGVNAIYAAFDDMMWLRNYKFDRISPLLGSTLMNVTVIHAGTQHNVVPDKCVMTVDVRTNELYTNEEVLDIIRSNVRGEVNARSTRLQSSSIPENHPIVRKIVAMGGKPFGSPTLSDQALMPFQSLKLGPGQSSRSHSADEYICLDEISEAIDLYVQLLDGLEL